MSGKSGRAGASEPSFEASIGRLEAIVDELERGEQPLETALERFQEGLEIGRRCRAILERAELRIRELMDVELSEEDAPDDPTGK